jgi:hypothetical protein
MKKFAILLSIVQLCCYSAAAEGADISVEHTSPIHTKIVIHNTSPEAFRERNARAREAGRRLEIKRQQKHELELARIEAEERDARARAQAQAQMQQPTIYRKKPYQPAPFMNGGRPTMGFGFGGFSTVGYGYGGFAPRPYAYRGRCGNRAFRPRGVSSGRCRTTRRVSRPVRRVSRGRRCR